MRAKNHGVDFSHERAIARDETILRGCTSVILLERPVDTVPVAALHGFAHRIARVLGLGDEVSILITDSHHVRALNRRFRKKDKTTDVLSFPRQDESGKPGGDIAICSEVAAENAVAYGHTADEEIKILILHGMLHLAGYDHERDNGEMAARESALRKQFGLPNSLIERSNRNSNRKRSPLTRNTRRRQKAKAN